MKRLNVVMVAAACAAVGLLAGTARGQYYTPLRYDLRYTSPAYIPSGTMRFGPAARPYDPYRFGNYNPGNLSVTGNLRLGKSFQGTSPYRSTGSQLSMDVPSTRLSNFRRDSIGIADVGTGLEYGGLGAFYPGSASVTTPYTAGVRFAVPQPGLRAPYAPRNVNAPPLPYWSNRGGVFTGGYGTADTVPTVESPMTTGGLAIPPSVLNDMTALFDGRTSPMPDEVTEPPAPTGVDDLYRSPYEKFGHAFESKPTNIFIEDDQTGAHAGDMTMPDDPSALFWQGPEAAGTQGPWMLQQQEAAGTTLETDQAPSTRPEDAWPEQNAADQTALDGQPVLATPMPVSTYAVYVMRAHAAMKEGAYGKAEALYAAGVALEPDRPAAFFGRIHALLARRMYLQVAVVLERELARHPQWATAAPNLRGVYPKAEVNVYDRIVAELERELADRPDDVRSNLLMGYLYYATGQYRKAKPYLEKAARAPDDKPGAAKAMIAAIEAR